MEQARTLGGLRRSRKASMRFRSPLLKMRKGQCLTAVETFRREPLNFFRGPKISIPIFRKLLLPRYRFVCLALLKSISAPTFCLISRVVSVRRFTLILWLSNQFSIVILSISHESLLMLILLHLLFSTSL